MDQLLIEQAMGKLLKTFIASYPIKVAWPNVTFIPPSGEAWLKPDVMPATTVALSLQQTDRTLSGIYQVLVVFPPDIGIQGAMQLAGLLAAHLEAAGMTASLTQAGGELYFTGPATVGGWYIGDYGPTIPIRINYRSDI